MSVRWPGTLETTSFNLQLLLLDMDSLSLSCLVGNSPATTYALTTMIFPALILWLSFCHALSQCGCLQRCGLKSWKLPYTLNTMGLLLQVGFGTIAAVSLKPVMCFVHPNGLHSILSYPSVFCGESGHSFMMVCGSFLLTIFVLGFIVACSYAMWNLPAWSRKGEDSKVQTFRFCTSHFRFDVYWFSLLLLLRGLSFALAIAVGNQLATTADSIGQYCFGDLHYNAGISSSMEGSRHEFCGHIIGCSFPAFGGSVHRISEQRCGNRSPRVLHSILIVVARQLQKGGRNQKSFGGILFNVKMTVLNS